MVARIETGKDRLYSIGHRTRANDLPLISIYISVDTPKSGKPLSYWRTISSSLSRIYRPRQGLELRKINQPPVYS